jgi:hypothetical protein
MRSEAKEEQKKTITEIKEIEDALLQRIIPPDPMDYRNVILEVRAGLLACSLFSLFVVCTVTEKKKKKKVLEAMRLHCLLKKYFTCINCMQSERIGSSKCCLYRRMT